MKIAAEIEWRKDGFGKDHQALYLGGLWVGSIMYLTDRNGLGTTWRGWFNCDDDGDETGWFPTAEEARTSVEQKLFNAIQVQRE